MGSKPKAKDELKLALNSVNHAKDFLITVEDNENRQILQNTLASVNDAVNATKTSSYGFKD